MADGPTLQPARRGHPHLRRSLLAVTATISAFAACFFSASTWFFQMRPQPTSAKRMRRPAIGL